MTDRSKVIAKNQKKIALSRVLRHIVLWGLIYIFFRPAVTVFSQLATFSGLALFSILSVSNAHYSTQHRTFPLFNQTTTCSLTCGTALRNLTTQLRQSIWTEPAYQFQQVKLLAGIGHAIVHNTVSHQRYGNGFHFCKAFWSLLVHFVDLNRNSKRTKIGI